MVRNIALEKKLKHITTLTEVTDLVCARAVSIRENNRIPINTKKVVFKPDTERPWKICLKGIRAQKKLFRLVKAVAYEFSETKGTKVKQRIAAMCDMLKQMIRVLRNRTRRYNEKRKRRRNNKMYRANQK
ncbi:hypothetical protein HHI36_001257 [Cryptolaemus montrouzieri]|uniref:60S ribosomal protein L36 n=1 Tax=Cryptolaemus montrouzieri TaxID=559131 RepID=A0ABD2P7G3_9CUCU